MIALRNVMLVQMWCRHTFGAYSYMGGSEAGLPFAM